MSSLELLAFSGLFGLLFVFTRSWFVMGGAFGCLLSAGKHWLSRRHIESKPS